MLGEARRRGVHRTRALLCLARAKTQAIGRWRTGKLHDVAAGRRRLARLVGAARAQEALKDLAHSLARLVHLDNIGSHSFVLNGSHCCL